MESLIAELERVAGRIEKARGGAAENTSGGCAVSVAAYDSFLQDTVSPFEELSKKIGGDGEKAVRVLFDAQ